MVYTGQAGTAARTIVPPFRCLHVPSRSRSDQTEVYVHPLGGCDCCYALLASPLSSPPPHTHAHTHPSTCEHTHTRLHTLPTGARGQGQHQRCAAAQPGGNNGQPDPQPATAVSRRTKVRRAVSLYSISPLPTRPPSHKHIMQAPPPPLACCMAHAGTAPFYTSEPPYENIGVDMRGADRIYKKIIQMITSRSYFDLHCSDI